MDQYAVRPRVIEMNVETVRTLQGKGIDAAYGDATRPDTLVAGGTQYARSLIISVGGMTGVEETIRIAREFNADIRVLARTTDLREAAAIRRAGADVVFSGEGEVALAFTEANSPRSARPRSKSNANAPAFIRISDDVSRRGARPPHCHSGAKDCRRIRSSTPTLTPKRAQASTRPISP
jgi:voltage-gated potassium channel Kch